VLSYRGCQSDELTPPKLEELGFEMVKSASNRGHSLTAGGSLPGAYSWKSRMPN